MSNQPTIVCLCGSTRFSAEYQKANLKETLKGNIVLTIGCDMKSDVDLFKDMNEDELKVIKDRLDELHKRKIDLADEVLILNVGGYVGSSTMGEIEYAISQSKRLRWLEPMSSELWQCPGIEIEPSVFSGCTGTGGDCPTCGK